MIKGRLRFTFPFLHSLFFKHFSFFHVLFPITTSPSHLLSHDSKVSSGSSPSIYEDFFSPVLRKSKVKPYLCLCLVSQSHPQLFSHSFFLSASSAQAVIASLAPVGVCIDWSAAALAAFLRQSGLTLVVQGYLRVVTDCLLSSSVCQ